MQEDLSNFCIQLQLQWEAVQHDVREQQEWGRLTRRGWGPSGELHRAQRGLGWAKGWGPSLSLPWAPWPTDGAALPGCLGTCSPASALQVLTHGPTDSLKK